jgi:hypothetical protein
MARHACHVRPRAHHFCLSTITPSWITRQYTVMPPPPPILSVCLSHVHVHQPSSTIQSHVGTIDRSDERSSPDEHPHATPPMKQVSAGNAVAIDHRNTGKRTPPRPRPLLLGDHDVTVGSDNRVAARHDSNLSLDPRATALGSPRAPPSPPSTTHTSTTISSGAPSVAAAAADALVRVSHASTSSLKSLMGARLPVAHRPSMDSGVGTMGRDASLLSELEMLAQETMSGGASGSPVARSSAEGSTSQTLDNDPSWFNEDDAWSPITHSSAQGNAFATPRRVAGEAIARLSEGVAIPRSPVIGASFAPAGRLGGASSALSRRSTLTEGQIAVVLHV